MGKTIAFHDNNLSLRGSSIALYNYADYNEKILGGKSIIMAKPDDKLNQAKQKFEDRFPTHYGWWNDSDLDNFMSEYNVDYFYSIRAGNKSDGSITHKVPSLIHVVFRINDPHGSKYAYTSDWLAKDQGYNPEQSAVPLIVEKLPTPIHNLREQLGIPKHTTVFGCYGGATEFNIGFVHKAIIDTVKTRKDIIFLFMNINPFTTNHEQIIHLQGTYDLIKKSEFVNACDAMIHARFGGETFGLACAEFALENKPVITYGLSGESNHIEILDKKGIYYSTYDELFDILNNLSKYKIFEDYHSPYLKFSPEIIMEKFNRIFLS